MVAFICFSSKFYFSQIRRITKLFFDAVNRKTVLFCQFIEAQISRQIFFKNLTYLCRAFGIKFKVFIYHFIPKRGLIYKTAFLAFTLHAKSSSFADDITFKLCKGRYNVKHQLSGGRSSLNPVPEGYKINAPLFQLLDSKNQIF